MDINIEKTEQYIVLQPLELNLQKKHATLVEKKIAGLFSAEGRINYILNLSDTQSIEDNWLALFSKIQRLIDREQGIFIVVSKNIDIIDKISSETEEDIVTLSTVEEAIDAVFMNELENDFKTDNEDDEFGLNEESQNY